MLNLGLRQADRPVDHPGQNLGRRPWQNWPARTAPLIAAKLGVPVEPVLEALTEHVHQQLVELGDPEADFSDASEA